MAIIRSMATRWSDADVAATLNRMILTSNRGFAEWGGLWRPWDAAPDEPRWSRGLHHDLLAAQAGIPDQPAPENGDPAALTG